MSLKVSYEELRREVGRHLGFDRNPGNWDADQTQDVADIIKAGQWHFYWPPSIDPAGGRAHLWSFLCASEELAISNGAMSYDLPDDFVRLQSGFTFGLNGQQMRLAVIEDELLRSMQSKNSIRDVPRYVTIRSRDDRQNEGYEIALYPTPERGFTLEFRYERLPDQISEDNPYHLGPAVHSKLLVSACLMEADRKLNAETINPDGGLQAQQFFRQLVSSIAIDREATGIPLAP